MHTFKSVIDVSLIDSLNFGTESFICWQNLCCATLGKCTPSNCSNVFKAG